jgi:hypothetical protein
MSGSAIRGTGPDNRLDYGSVSGSVSGTSQTKLAARAAPPEKATSGPLLVVGMSLLALIVTAVVVLFLHRQDHSPELPEWMAPFHARVLDWCLQQRFVESRPDLRSFLERLGSEGQVWALCIYIPLGVALLSLPFGLRNTIWNLTTHPRLMKQWKEKWYCHRCGIFFLNP